MKEQIRRKIGELSARIGGQWSALMAAKSRREILEESKAIKEAREEEARLRVEWCATRDSINGLELTLRELDGFGASDAEVTQPIGLEAK